MPRRATVEMLDTLAEGVAAGLFWHEAASRAGYAPTSRSYYRLRNDPAFQRRIERCRRRREWGGIGDLGDMIGSLLKLSQRTQDDTAGRNVSRLCLVSAAQFFVKMEEIPFEDGTFRQPAGTLRQHASTYGHTAGTSTPPAGTIISREAEELRRATAEWAATVGVK